MLAEVRPRVIREPYSWQAGWHLFCLGPRPACVGPTRHILSAPAYSPLPCLLNLWPFDKNALPAFDRRPIVENVSTMAFGSLL